MSERVISRIAISVLAAAIMLGTDCAKLAADDCLAGPNRPPGPGGHWYYHLDRASNRTCWYLVAVGRPCRLHRTHCPLPSQRRRRSPPSSLR